MNLFHIDLPRSLAHQAACDAAMSASFLQELNLRMQSAHPEVAAMRFPSDFVAGLGFVLRCAVWEQLRLYPHMEAGLPRARDTLVVLATRAASGPADEYRMSVRSYCLKVLQISCQWLMDEGTFPMDTDILIGTQKEDNLLKALADTCVDLSRRCLPKPSIPDQLNVK